MNRTFSKLSLVSLILLVLASFALTPAAEARGGGRGGGGGGARASAQPSMSRADTRSNDVRSTSVNNVNTQRNVSSERNVNIDRDVNVDIDVDGDYHGGWDHPVAGAMVVGGAMAVTAAAIGSMVATVPAGCVPVNYGGVVYQQCGSTWYMPQGSQFVVVSPPY